METGLLHMHSFLRWIILALLLVAIYRHVTAGNRLFTSTDKKVGLILLICCDLMLLIGLYQWFAGPLGLQNIKLLGMKDLMGNGLYRFFAAEHSLGMLIAIILVHVGKTFSKKNISDKLKHQRTFIFFFLALLIIMVSIPWPFREVGIGRGWF